MTDTRWILATDLDGTIIPPQGAEAVGPGLSEFRELLGTRSDVVLAYVTGRHLELARKGISLLDLPEPDLLVCDVGTSVYRFGPGGYELDPDYREAMANALGDVSPGAIRRALGGIGALEMQEGEKQADFKISYYVAKQADSDVVLREARSRLSGLGASASLVHSHEVNGGRGLLDVLPGGVAKDRAVLHLHEHIGVGREQLVYAGDSGNDLAVMLAGYRAVVVGNATADFKDQVRRESIDEGVADRVYFARERYASGVLEGCRHFGLL